MRHTINLYLLIPLLVVAGCSRLEQVGKVPPLTPIQGTNEYHAMVSTEMPQSVERQRRTDTASLWDAGRNSLLGDQRAAHRGDILTVVIEIDEKAEISNSSARSRSGSEAMGVPNLFGIPQRVDQSLPEGATLGSAVEINSSSRSNGDGSVRRKEKITLRVAATVIDVLQNGILSIQGSQEVRVNFEVRELLVTGYVRPEDISRQNQITYDKIASARISYGGRGQITNLQQPRYGQQAAEIILPF